MSRYHVGELIGKIAIEIFRGKTNASGETDGSWYVRLEQKVLQTFFKILLSRLRYIERAADQIFNVQTNNNFINVQDWFGNEKREKKVRKCYVSFLVDRSE